MQKLPTAKHADLVLILAIIGLTGLLTWVMPLAAISAFAAWLMARGYLKKINLGIMDSAKKGTLRSAKIMAIIALIMSALLAIALTSLIYLNRTINKASGPDWQPEDPAHISLEALQQNRNGLILDIYAPAGVEKVEHEKFDDFSLGRTYTWRLRYWASPGATPDKIKLLINWPAYPGMEERIAVKSKDGFWLVVEFTQKKGELSNAQWDRLKPTATAFPLVGKPWEDAPEDKELGDNKDLP